MHTARSVTGPTVEGTGGVASSRLTAAVRLALPFPPEVTDGISEEQFVRDVVDILFLNK